MTKTIIDQDLRNRSSDVLRQVQQGECLEITDHGEVVAVLVPVQELPLGGLRHRPATTQGGFSTLHRHRLTGPSQQVWDDLRGDR